MKKEAIVLNMFGGPGTGKSILTTEIFARLKRNFIKCEISSEYYKKKLREEAAKVIQNQIYVFGKQQFQLFTLKDKVDVIVTDSPIIFSAIYNEPQCPELNALILKEFNKYNNINYYIERDKNVPYEQEGRYQDENGAKLVDNKVKIFLDENKIEYTTLSGIGKDSLSAVVNHILELLDKNDK